MVAGWEIRLSTPPKLSARLSTLTPFARNTNWRFRTATKASWPQPRIVSAIPASDKKPLTEAAARIVQPVPDLDAKFYAATQVMDEARHVEAYARLLNEKLGIAYPITPGLKSLLETVLTDRRWDMTYLGMQILIEGLALAAFQRIRDFAKNRLAASVNAYVMQDEARHVAFGRLALRDFYPQLSDGERAEREEFVVEACYHMRDRFNQKELWENLGLPVKEAIEVAMASENMRMFRKRLFSRIVPTVKDIGLWGPSVQKAFADMGAIEFADVDSDALLDQDNRVAEEFDAGVFVRKSLA